VRFFTRLPSLTNAAPLHFPGLERPNGAAVQTSTKARTITMDWRQRAACLDEDPELFFPVGTTGPALDQVERAKQVCRRCDVAEACLEWALDTNQDAGVWGGMSEDERRSLRRSRQRRRRLAS
jgi:WhiB family transcriptional regulator, redox-sensing transcriptional regulator